jgi:hypothetical protein
LRKVRRPFFERASVPHAKEKLVRKRVSFSQVFLFQRKSCDREVEGSYPSLPKSLFEKRLAKNSFTKLFGKKFYQKPLD